MSRGTPGNRYAAWRLFPSSRVNRSTVVAVAFAGLATLMLASSSYHQPFSEWEVAAATAPLAPGAVVLLSSFGMINVMAVLEGHQGSRLLVARLAWSTTLACTVAAFTALAAWSVDAQWRLPMLRNALGLSGLGFLGAVVLGARQAWVPVFLCLALTFAVGRDPYTAAARGWALLLAPGGSVVASLAAGGMLIAGVGVYTWRDSRPTQGIPGEG